MKKIYTLVLMMKVIAFVSKAQTAGTFDSTFSTDGMAIYNWQDNYLDPRLLEQPDGKLLISGSKGDGKYFIIRINSDSTLDAGFGINGFVEDSITGYGFAISSMQIESNGNIIVSLTGGDATFTNQMFAYARYLNTGIIDSTFGTNGYVMKTPSANAHYRNLISPVFNNQYVIAEAIDSMGTFTTSYQRLNIDGSFDAAFGNTGNVTLSNFLMEGTAWLASGKFIIYGFELFATGYSLIRYNSNGTIDSSYGNNGTVLEQMMNFSLGHIFADTAGNAFTCLQYGFPNTTYRISKFDSAGVKDAGFGITGDKDLTNDRFINLLAFEHGGKIVAGGFHINATGGENLLQRWLADGTDDFSFANGGELLFTSTAQSSEQIYSIALSSSGKIYTLSSGYLQVTQDNFFFVSRFHNDLGTGIHDAVAEQNNFLIYPNPANGEFIVSGLQLPENEKAEIKIFNMIGKEIYSEVIKTANHRLKTVNLANGTYFVQLKSGNKTATQKLIISH